jgi:hypothetical protein
MHEFELKAANAKFERGKCEIERGKCEIGRGKCEIEPPKSFGLHLVFFKSLRLHLARIFFSSLIRLANSSRSFRIFSRSFCHWRCSFSRRSFSAFLKIFFADLSFSFSFSQKKKSRTNVRRKKMQYVLLTCDNLKCLTTIMH